MTYQPIPYSTPAPQTPDDGHLRALAICHYVWGGLTILVSSIFIIHIVLGAMITTGAIPLTTTPATRPTTATTTTIRTGTVTVNTGGAPLPNWFGYVFIGVGSAVVLLGWTIGILTILSGRCIAKRRRRVFSLVMAGINCANFPLGTLLGVFTFIVLLRQSVKMMYERNVAG